MSKNDVIFIPPVIKIFKDRNVLANVVTFENSLFETAHRATFHCYLKYHYRTDAIKAHVEYSD